MSSGWYYKELTHLLFHILVTVHCTGNWVYILLFIAIWSVFKLRSLEDNVQSIWINWQISKNKVRCSSLTALFSLTCPQFWRTNKNEREEFRAENGRIMWVWAHLHVTAQLGERHQTLLYNNRSGCHEAASGIRSCRTMTWEGNTCRWSMKLADVVHQFKKNILYTVLQ